MEASLKQAPFEMDADQRVIALDAIREVCRHKHWALLAAHVRTNHVHTVVDRYLRSAYEIESAIRYVLEKQGDPMAFHPSP